MCRKDLLEQLIKTLQEVKLNAKNDFSGIGIVIHKNIKDVPIFPLRANKFKVNPTRVVDDLLEISSYSSEFHDGFHFISDSFKLTHTSQYFSPPIVSNAKVDYSQQLGGRFVAALFGSFLQDVLFTGILTKGSGIKIFRKGKVIYSECWKDT
ncbi:hypothetical protein BT052_RS04330 [Vibrio parahaemolyticus]|nr:hypothetical protein [Vibrio parahaemolyticus]